MEKLTFTLTYEIIRKVIARLTRRPQEQIFALDKLASFFSPAGFFKLENAINSNFETYKVTVTKTEIDKCLTVNDLLLLVWDKVPESIQEVTPLMQMMATNNELFVAYELEISLTSKLKRVKKSNRRKSHGNV